jgi:acyl-CoA thioester hydrolase
VGRSSVRYRIGLFAVGARLAAAHGEFVHVYVDRQQRRPTDLPAPLRAALLALRPDPPCSPG